MPAIIIALMGLLSILSFSLRATSVSWKFGLVKVSIPILAQKFVPNLNDPVVSPHTADVSAYTPVIVLTDYALLFGPLDAFTSNIHDVRTKFSIPHHEGAPQVQNLLNQVGKWQPSMQNSPVLLLVDSDWPVAIVIQMIYYLEQSEIFSSVALAGGYL